MTKEKSPEFEGNVNVINVILQVWPDVRINTERNMDLGLITKVFDKQSKSC